MSRLWLLLALLTGSPLSVPALAEPIPGRLPGPGEILQDGGLTVPESWSGIWLNSIRTADCGEELGPAAGAMDTLCTGDAIEDLAPLADATCSGSIDDTTVDLMCTGTLEVFPGCVGNVTVELDGTRTGDNLLIDYTVAITYTGTGIGCTSIPDSCDRFEVQGARIGPAPPEACLTPVERVTWSGIKARFR